jgi:hypothetical protein
MSGTRVLAVGLEPRTVLPALTSVLTWEGMEAQVVAGPEEAMAAIDANRPDIVFVGDLAYARPLAEATGDAATALVIETVGLKLEEAAYKLHVRPFSSDDVVGLPGSSRTTPSSTSTPPRSPSAGGTGCATSASEAFQKAA